MIKINNYYAPIIYVSMIFIILSIIFYYIEIPILLRTLISLTITILLVVSYYIFSDIEFELNDIKKERQKKPIFYLLIFSSILVFFYFYSYYSYHKIYLPNGWDTPRYLYFTKLIYNGELNYLLDMQTVIRISNLLSFYIFSKISPLTLFTDFKIYSCILTSTLSILFSYYAFILNKTKLSFLIGIIVSISSYSVLELSFGLIDNLFSLILMLLFFYIIIKNHENPRLIHVFIGVNSIILIGICHFETYGLLNIILITIILTEIVVRLKNNIRVRDIIKKDIFIRTLIFIFILSNIVVIILQSIHIRSYILLSHFYSDTILTNPINISLKAVIIQYGFYSILSIIFFLYLFKKNNSFKYRLLFNWYFVCLILFFGRYVGILYPPMRILLVSPIPILVSLGIYELIIKIKNVGYYGPKITKVICFVCLIIVMSNTLSNIYSKEEYVSYGNPIIPDIEEINNYLATNNIKRITFLYNYPKNLPIEEVVTKLPPQFYYILEEFYTKNSRVELIYFGTVEDYLILNKEFYSKVEYKIGDKNLKRQFWYKQLLKYNLDNKPKYIIVHYKFAKEELNKYYSKDYSEIINDNCIVIDAEKMGGDND